MTDYERLMLAWDMYYSGLVAIQYHPANPAEGRLSLAELGDVADQMLYERSFRCLRFGQPE